MADDRKDIGALWTKAKRDGERYMTGVVMCPHCQAATKIVAWKNNRKTSERQPDARIFPDGREAAPQPRREQAPPADGSDIPYDREGGDDGGSDDENLAF